MNPPAIPPAPLNRWALQRFDTPITLGSVIENLLKFPGRVLHECQSGSMKVPVLLCLISLFCLGVFGWLLGTFSGGTQLWAAPAKVAGGTLFAVLICMPSLYIFSALGGVEAKLSHMLGVLLAAIALTALLLLGFAPIVWVFSQSTESLPFMGFLALAFWLIGLSFGLKLLHAAAASLGGQSNGYLSSWILIFVVVTLQVSTAVRPIIGKADTLLPTEKRFFIGHWLKEMDLSSERAAD
jgi:hypothetical protein